jgi:hypothetical protein
MSMDEKQFKKYLLVYGADVHQWPEEIRGTAVEALADSSELRALQADHEGFEGVLTSRSYQEPPSTLAQRIISASQQGRKRTSLSRGAFFSELLAGFSLRRWALIAIAVLIIGFIIGLVNPIGSLVAEETQTDLQEFLYYEGEAL